MEQERTLPGTEQESKPVGNNTPADQTPAPDFDELDTEIDKHLGEAPEDLKVEEGDDGETVTLKKSDLEKYKTKTNNVLEGLKSVKTRVKSLKEKVKAPAPQGQVQQQPPSSAGQPESSEFVTKKELYRANEREAIKIAEGDKVLSDNWGDVMKHFISKRGKGTKEDVVADINDAFILWQHNNPDKAKQAGITEVRKIQNQLASDTSKPAGDTSDGQKTTDKKKSVLPKKSKASAWYKGDKK